MYDLLIYRSGIYMTIYCSGKNKLYMASSSIGVAQTSYIWRLDLLEWHKQAIYDLLVYCIGTIIYIWPQDLLEWHKQAIYDLLLFL